MIWPTTCGQATSITTQGTTARIRSLLRVGGKDTIRFLSVEPQHERLDLSKLLAKLDWVIQGGESGRGATPFQIEWALDLMHQCREAGASYFLKQLGSVVFRDGQRVSFEDGHGGDWTEWPKELRVRQMPKDFHLFSGDTAPVIRPRIDLPVIPSNGKDSDADDERLNSASGRRSRAAARRP